jgi:hypothetical protein
MDRRKKQRAGGRRPWPHLEGNCLNTSSSDFAPDIYAPGDLTALGYNLIGIKDSGANYVDGTIGVSETISVRDAPSLQLAR